MSSVTLVESAKLAQNELIAGVIEDIITVNQMFDVLPFDGIEGNALEYNRENVLGPVATVAVGEDIGPGVAAGGNQAERLLAKDPATFNNITVGLTTILGDAEVNGLIQATRSGDGNDQTAVQISSKAKSAGRKYQELLINGVAGTPNEFDGLTVLCAAGQTIAAAANGDDIGPGDTTNAVLFDKLDNLIDLVVDKDGQVDYFIMHARSRRFYRAKLRALGGASVTEVVELPSGEEVIGYSSIPIFRNDYISIAQTQGTSTDATTIFAGTLDDGSQQQGIAGLTAEKQSGIVVVDVGESETKDERIWRVKWYSSLALFSEKGLACAPGLTP